MKVLPLGMLVSASFAIVACETMNQPISTGTFDPLAAPGSGSPANTPSFGSELSPGSFVTANIPNTAFYNKRPKGNADADKLLTQGTNMKIVSIDPDYVKVELDSGEVGWIPSVMVTSANAAPEAYPTDGTYQVYPPLPEAGLIEPLPIIDPGGVPPEGAIPTIIDPDAPVPVPGDPITIDPIPDLKPATPEATPDDAPKEKAVDKEAGEAVNADE